MEKLRKQASVAALREIFSAPDGYPEPMRSR